MRQPTSRTGILALLLAVGSPLSAQDVAELEAGGAPFLLFPVGGRAAALGQAAVADGGSSESAFWNPAGLARLRRGEFAVHHANTFVSNNTALAGYVSAPRLGVLGASAYLVDLGDQDVVSEAGAVEGQLSLKNIELLASYATRLAGDLTFGLNYKLIQFRQDCSGNCTGAFRTLVGTTHAVDVGLQYAFGANDNPRVGLAVQHAGFKLQIENRDQADPLPTRVQLGAVYRVELPRPTGEEEGLDARFLLDVRDAWGRYDNPDVRLGLELGYSDIVHLRTGYAFLHSETRGPSIGVGLRLGRVTIDFARIFFVSSNFDEPVHISLRTSL